MNAFTEEPRHVVARTARGFTLIELLVVIAIIGLLVSILVPSLRTAKQLAQQAVCKSNVRSISLAQVLYCSDNDDKLAPMKIYQDVYRSGATRAYGIGLLAKYLDGEDIGYDDWSDFVALGKRINAKWSCPTIANHLKGEYIQKGWSSAYPFNLPLVELGDPEYVSSDRSANGYWIGWMPDYPLEHRWPNSPGKYWAGRWPDRSRIEGVAGRFIIMREKALLWYGPERPTHGYESSHLDNSLTYAYADGHVETGDWFWYIWTE